MYTRRFAVLAGLSAVLGSAGLLLGAGLPSAAATPQGVHSRQAISYVTRGFQCTIPGECKARAVLPKTWKQVNQSRSKTAFQDPHANRLIRFQTWGGDSTLTTSQAAKRRVAVLQGTPGLKVRKIYTTTMRSTTGQGKLTLTTVVYTYQLGKTTRWVASRFFGQYGSDRAEVEITVAGYPADAKLLGTALLKATQSFAIVG